MKKDISDVPECQWLVSVCSLLADNWWWVAWANCSSVCVSVCGL